jgi:hypothetical protein
MNARTAKMVLAAASAMAVAASPEIAAAQAKDDTLTREAPAPVVTPPPPEQPPTVLHGKLDLGGYGAPEVRMSSVARTPALFAGAQGGLILGHQLIIGAAGYGLATEQTAPALLQPAGGGAKLTIGYGGLRIAGIIASDRLVNFTVGALAGGGAVGSQVRGGAGTGLNDTFWILEPDATVDVNLAKQFRLSTGLAYRFVGGLDVSGMTATQIGGASLTISLKVGSF